jgi:hypothetical protein
VPLRSHLLADKILNAGNGPLLWRKFIGRAVPSRYNSSRVLELKKGTVKKETIKYLMKLVVVQSSHCILHYYT